MAALEKRNIESPDETRPFHARGHADVVTLGDFTLGRAVYEPGWRWSQDVKPVAGTESCQIRHTGFCVSGNITVRANDGTQESFGPGDVLLIEPGHDAWVDGDEPCIMLDTGVAPYVKPAPH